MYENEIAFFEHMRTVNKTDASVQLRAALDTAIALMRAAEEIRLLCVEADESGDSRIDTDLIWGKLRKAIEQQ